MIFKRVAIGYITDSCESCPRSGASTPYTTGRSLLPWQNRGGGRNSCINLRKLGEKNKVGGKEYFAQISVGTLR